MPRCDASKRMTIDFLREARTQRQQQQQQASTWWGRERGPQRDNPAAHSSVSMDGAGEGEPTDRGEVAGGTAEPHECRLHDATASRDHPLPPVDTAHLGASSAVPMPRAGRSSRPPLPHRRQRGSSGSSDSSCSSGVGRGGAGCGCVVGVAAPPAGGAATPVAVPDRHPAGRRGAEPLGCAGAALPVRRVRDVTAVLPPLAASTSGVKAFATSGASANSCSLGSSGAATTASAAAAAVAEVPGLRAPKGEETDEDDEGGPEDEEGADEVEGEEPYGFGASALGGWGEREAGAQGGGQGGIGPALSSRRGSPPFTHALSFLQCTPLHLAAHQVGAGRGKGWVGEEYALLHLDAHRVSVCGGKGWGGG